MTEYIKKADVIRELCLACRCRMTAKVCEAVKGAIEAIPAAEVEPVRHGHWEKDFAFAKCSLCGVRPIIAYDFCPYCGAKMDEVTEDEID